MSPGDIVWSQHGEEAELVAKTGGEFVVRPIFEDDDGPQFGEIQTWRTAFRTPPTPKLDKQTADAEKRLASLSQQVSALEKKQYDLNREMEARKDRIKQHEEMALLDRYLAGEITHYVAAHDYYPELEIIPVTETVESYSSNQGYGLLTLMPSTGWDKKLRWSVYFKTADRWTSSRTCRVYPCGGEEEAKAKVIAVLGEFIAEYLAKDRDKRGSTDRLIASCRRFGVEVPAELIEGEREKELRNLTKSRDDLRKKFEEAEAAIAKATGEQA